MNYKYCGLTFSSDLEFPFFRETYEATVFSVKLDCKSSIYKNKPAVFMDEASFIVNFGPDGFYRITKDHIICNFYDTELIKATLGNIPFAIVAILNGFLPIHCSSIMRHDSSAILFLGSKGQGKTTLAFYLNKYMGYHLLGDDVITLSVVDEKNIVFPGVTKIKLCKDIMEKEVTYMPERDYDEVYKNWNKFYYTPLAYSETPEYLELHRMFALHRSSSLELLELPGFMYSSYLIKNIVGISYIETLLAKEIVHLVHNVKKIDIATLAIPDGLEHLKTSLPLLCKGIEEYE